MDQYQGRDKLVIIYSCTRSNDGRGQGAGHILLDTRRLNVAVTRAKAKLVIVGDRASLSRDYAPFVKLSSFFKESDVIKLTNNEIDSICEQTCNTNYPCRIVKLRSRSRSGEGQVRVR